jgi:hypothetical protein
VVIVWVRGAAQIKERAPPQTGWRDRCVVQRVQKVEGNGLRSIESVAVRSKRVERQGGEGDALILTVC